MQSLAKGANAPLPSGPVAVRRRGAPVDISALLLTGGRQGPRRRRLRLLQPAAAAGRALPRRTASTSTPTAVDAEIESVTVTASLDGRGPATSARSGGLRMDVAVGGTPVAAFEPDGLGAETALLCVEIYRRGGQWKVRAVGQGYADGLAGIATDFGITVEDDAPPPPPPPPRAQRPAPASGKINLTRARCRWPSGRPFADQDRRPAAAPGRDGPGLGPGRRAAATSTWTPRRS